MHCTKAILPFLLLIFPVLLNAQTHHRISGTIRDKRTGETLIGASVILSEQSHAAVLSNAYGFYSIDAIAGNYKMVVSFTGYNNDTVAISLNADVVVAIELVTGGPELQEVVITANKNNNNVSKPLMGVQKLSISEIKDLPILFGEKDILKTIQLLPGVQSGGDGNCVFL